MLYGDRMTREERERYQVGRERFERGDVEGALAPLEHVLLSCPRYADVHYMVGIVRERRGDLEGATESLERALDINPGYAEAAVALVSVYEQQGLFDRSRSLTEQLASGSLASTGDSVTRGKLANLQAALGDAYREAGDVREAVEAYRKAIDRCPGYHDIRHRLGIALREAGLPSQSIAEFKRVLRANPSFLASKVQLGLTFYSMGRVGEARDEWEAALGLDPGCDDARMYLRLVG